MEFGLPVMNVNRSIIIKVSLNREAPHEMFTGRTVRTSREMYGGFPVVKLIQSLLVEGKDSSRNVYRPYRSYIS